MLSSFIKYSIFVHSVRATCDGGAQNDKACKASFTSEEVVMVQRVAAKVPSAPGTRDHVADFAGKVPKVLEAGQQDLASIFSIAVRKLEAMTGFDIDRDGSVASKAKLETSESKEQATTDNNQTENRETESRETEWKNSVKGTAKSEKAEVKAGEATENNQTESSEAESREAGKKQAERKETKNIEGSKIRLAEISDVLSKPRHVFEELSLNVRSLEASLSEVQRQGIEAITAQTAEYEMTLETQRRNNTALVKKNKNTSARISALKTSNEDLRSRAQRLTKQCASVSGDLKVLQARISNAHDFIDNALVTYAENLSTAPQLKVLEELAQKDADMEKDRDHQNRLNQVRLSMLQLHDNVSKASADINVGTILASLKQDLYEMVKTRNATVAHLKTAFEKEFRAGEQYHNELLTEESKLNVTEAAALKLKERLTAAVEHLEQKHEALLQEDQNVRWYMQRFSSRSLQ